MAEYSVLIADSREEFARAAAEKLNGFCRVQVCSSAAQVLTEVRTREPELLVLDLMLPGMDGLSLLQAIRNSGRRPRVLAVSGYVSPWILESAGKLGVSCLLQKPCSPETAVRQICRLLQQKEPVEEILRRRISGLLLQLGIRPKLRGYTYLREAVFAMAFRPGQFTVRELYEQIGSRYAIPGKLVEHSVRSALQDAWKTRDRTLWDRYFGPGQQVRPTGAAFIVTVAECMRTNRNPVLKRAAGEN